MSAKRRFGEADDSSRTGGESRPCLRSGGGRRSLVRRRPVPEKYNAKPALLLKAFGTTTGISKPVLAAVTRAGVPFTGKKLALAIKCWKENVCDTGTGGKITVALADGFGENVWREVTHMEFVLGALTYPRDRQDHLHERPGQHAEGDLRLPQPDRPERGRHHRLPGRRRGDAAELPGRHAEGHRRRPVHVDAGRHRRARTGRRSSPRICASSGRTSPA